MADTGKGSTTRWATTATASASGTSGPANALGPPDTNAWGSNGLTAWLEVGFGTAERATALRVHETMAAPFVMRVDLQDEEGGWHTVYTGGDTTASGGWLVIPLGLTGYRVAKAKVYAQGTSGYGGVAVDAVGLDVVGLDVVGERYAYNGFNQLLTVEGVDGKQTSYGYDGNGNQVWKRERPGFVTQETSYGYDGDNRLRTVKVPVGGVGAAVEQWGATATASSAYGTGTASWAASQATGAPNVAGCVASGQSWLASSTTPGQWLQVGYAAPAKVVGVRIHETGNAGTVTKVELVDEGGTAHEVWAGTDGTQCGQWLEVKLPETAYRVASVKVTTKAQTQVDAVALVSEPAAGPTATVGYEYDANGLRTRKTDAAGMASAPGRGAHAHPSGRPRCGPEVRAADHRQGGRRANRAESRALASGTLPAIAPYMTNLAGPGRVTPRAPRRSWRGHRGSTMMGSAMQRLKAHVKGGRLLLDEPTDLPEGADVELVPLDEALASGGDGLDDEERRRLHDSIGRGLEDLGAGRTVAAEQVIAGLRARTAGR